MVFWTLHTALAVSRPAHCQEEIYVFLYLTQTKAVQPFPSSLLGTSPAWVSSSSYNVPGIWYHFYRHTKFFIHSPLISLSQSCVRAPVPLFPSPVGVPFLVSVQRSVICPILAAPVHPSAPEPSPTHIQHVNTVVP